MSDPREKGDFEGLTTYLFKGPDFMNKVFIASMAACFAVFMAILNNKEDAPPTYYSAIAVLLAAAAFLALISSFIFHSSRLSNGPKAAVIIGLISSALFTVTVPIISTYLISGSDYALFIRALVWALYLLLVLVVWICHLLPFPFNYDLPFWKKGKSMSTRVESEMSSPNYQSGEMITSSVAAETVIDVFDYPPPMVFLNGIQSGEMITSSVAAETVIDVFDDQPPMEIPTHVFNPSAPSVLQNGSSEVVAQEDVELEMSGPNYQSGEMTFSDAADTVIDVIDDPPPMEIPTQALNPSAPSVLQNGSSAVAQENVDKPAVVCFIPGGDANPTFESAMKGLFRKVWGKHRIRDISMLPNGIFVVEFHTFPQALIAAKGIPLLFDNAPVITKMWNPIDILEKEALMPDIGPVWIQLPGLEHWKPSCIKKLAEHVGKPLKVDGTRVLVEVINRHRQRRLPDWVSFVDTEGFWREQKVNYGHSSPKKIWVAKTSVSGAEAAPMINEIHESECLG